MAAKNIDNSLFFEREKKRILIEIEERKKSFDFLRFFGAKKKTKIERNEGKQKRIREEKEEMTKVVILFAFNKTKTNKLNFQVLFWWRK